MDKTNTPPLFARLADQFNINPALANQLVDAIRTNFPQVNDSTKCQRVNAPRIMIPEIVEQPRAARHIRLVRKPGYRWQFHRAFYELMDLPAFAAWGWIEEIYNVYPSIVMPSRGRELRLVAVPLFPIVDGRLDSPFGFIVTYHVAYLPERDVLYIRPPR